MLVFKLLGMLHAEWHNQMWNVLSSCLNAYEQGYEEISNL